MSVEPSWEDMLPWDVAMPGVMYWHWATAPRRAQWQRDEELGILREQRERENAARSKITRALSAKSVDLRVSALLARGAQNTPSGRGEASLISLGEKPRAKPGSIYSALFGNLRD